MSRIAFLAAAAFSFALPAHAALLENGDFSAGLGGWLLTDTANGRTIVNDVVEFETVAGEVSSAARFQTGQSSFRAGEYAGIIISQQFVPTVSSTYEISLDVAFSHPSFRAEGGRYTLWISGVVQDEITLPGLPSAGGTVRGSLSASVDLTAGTNVSVGLVITQRFITGNSVGSSAYQYVDNVVLIDALNTIGEGEEGAGGGAGTVVPLPAAAPLLLAGIGGLAVAGRRRRG